MDQNSFFSIDRLVEFGMGMAVAQQMVQTMNNAMTNMHVPGTFNSPEKPEQKIYYAMIEGNQTGPLSEMDMSRLIAEKKVVKETYVWMPTMPCWKMAEQIPDVLKLVALTPPPFNI
ncbi:MAG: DUF4339 domain-containing protein [Candidatus Kapabacteria bacterium]|nr:DUF4339 domain-containing protein [Candidatus Kapabacteria bacterium]